MKKKLYAVYDDVAKDFLPIFEVATDDCDFCRRNILPLAMRYPLRDIKYVAIADVESEGDKITITGYPKTTFGSWEAYKFPKQANSLNPDIATLEEIQEVADKAHSALVSTEKESEEVKK